MAKNVVSVKGGEVHLPSRFDDIPGVVFPFCRSGSQTNSGTKYVTTDEKATCKACKARLRGQRVPVQEKPAEPVQIPENWLYMARHANTETARAYWQKKCGIIEMEN